ncbi:MAG TPA: sigma-54 dependent transcriptional regulator [Blastocatellia bacterium]|nr:sigma-54 dependent transcriptional regulator [Blastocatellia bacterium]
MTSEPIKLLIAEDERNLSFVFQKELSRHGYDVMVANDGETAINLARTQEFHVALLDLMMPGADGLSILRVLREQEPAPEAVMMTGHATVETALQAMKLGAYDYLTKPCNLTEVTELLDRAYEKHRLKRENMVLQSLVSQRLEAPATRLGYQEGIVTRSVKMRDVLTEIDRVAPSNAPVLINGESGSGKELVARAIHRASQRSGKPFVDLNCAAVAETLVESELFGHEAGAFTSARARKLGLFELANHGTLFLDEISELSPQLQSKLLRVLETMNFFRVGGTRKVEVDVRIIAATNVDLSMAVRQGRFRNDLFYRINSIRLMLPPLRERPEDVLLIAQHFLNVFAPQRKLAISPEAQQILLGYNWPGNVRELRNMMERAVLLATSDAIKPQDLPIETSYKEAAAWLIAQQTGQVVGPFAGMPAGAGSGMPAMPMQSYMNGNQAGNGLDMAVMNPPTVDHGVGAVMSKMNGLGAGAARLEEIEKREILAALERTNWHQGRTAELLGISPSTLYRRLRAYNLSKRQVVSQQRAGR